MKNLATIHNQIPRLPWSLVSFRLLRSNFSDYRSLNKVFFEFHSFPISFIFQFSFCVLTLAVPFFISFSFLRIYFEDCFQTFEISKKNSTWKTRTPPAKRRLTTICPEAGHFRAHRRASRKCFAPSFTRHLPSTPCEIETRSVENWAGISMELATKNGSLRSIDRRDTAESTTRSHPVIQQRRRVHRAERKHESRVLERGRIHGLFYSLSIVVQFHFRRFTPISSGFAPSLGTIEICKEENFDSARRN